METTITIEPMSITHGSDNAQKRPSINYSTTIPLDIPWQEAWTIIKRIVYDCFPNESANSLKLEAVTEDLAQDRYCFSVSGRVVPETREVTLDI